MASAAAKTQPRSAARATKKTAGKSLLRNQKAVATVSDSMANDEGRNSIEDRTIAGEKMEKIRYKVEMDLAGN